MSNGQYYYEGSHCPPDRDQPILPLQARTEKFALSWMTLAKYMVGHVGCRERYQLHGCGTIWEMWWANPCRLPYVQLKYGQGPKVTLVEDWSLWFFPLIVYAKHDEEKGNVCETYTLISTTLNLMIPHHTVVSCAPKEWQCQIKDHDNDYQELADCETFECIFRKLTKQPVLGYRYFTQPFGCVDSCKITCGVDKKSTETPSDVCETCHHICLERMLWVGVGLDSTHSLVWLFSPQDFKLVGKRHWRATSKNGRWQVDALCVGGDILYFLWTIDGSGYKIFTLAGYYFEQDRREEYDDAINAKDFFDLLVLRNVDFFKCGKYKAFNQQSETYLCACGTYCTPQANIIRLPSGISAKSLLLTDQYDWVWLAHPEHMKIYHQGFPFWVHYDRVRNYFYIIQRTNLVSGNCRTTFIVHEFKDGVRRRVWYEQLETDLSSCSFNCCECGKLDGIDFNIKNQYGVLVTSGNFAFNESKGQWAATASYSVELPWSNASPKESVNVVLEMTLSANMQLLVKPTLPEPHYLTVYPSGGDCANGLIYALATNLVQAIEEGTPADEDWEPPEVGIEACECCDLGDESLPETITLHYLIVDQNGSSLSDTVTLYKTLTVNGYYYVSDPESGYLLNSPIIFGCYSDYPDQEDRWSVWFGTVNGIEIGKQIDLSKIPYGQYQTGQYVATTGCKLWGMYCDSRFRITVTTENPCVFEDEPHADKGPDNLFSAGMTQIDYPYLTGPSPETQSTYELSNHVIYYLTIIPKCTKLFKPPIPQIPGYGGYGGYTGPNVDKKYYCLVGLGCQLLSDEEYYQAWLRGQVHSGPYDHLNQCKGNCGSVVPMTQCCRTMIYNFNVCVTYHTTEEKNYLLQTLCRSLVGSGCDEYCDDPWQFDDPLICGTAGSCVACCGERQFSNIPFILVEITVGSDTKQVPAICYGAYYEATASPGQIRVRISRTGNCDVSQWLVEVGECVSVPTGGCVWVWEPLPFSQLITCMSGGIRAQWTWNNSTVYLNVLGTEVDCDPSVAGYWCVHDPNQDPSYTCLQARTQSDLQLQPPKQVLGGPSTLEECINTCNADYYDRVYACCSGGAFGLVPRSQVSPHCRIFADAELAPTSSRSSCGCFWIELSEVNTPVYTLLNSMCTYHITSYGCPVLQYQVEGSVTINGDNIFPQSCGFSGYFINLPYSSMWGFYFTCETTWYTENPTNIVFEFELRVFSTSVIVNVYLGGNFIGGVTLLPQGCQYDGLLLSGSATLTVGGIGNVTFTFPLVKVK